MKLFEEAWKFLLGKREGSANIPLLRRSLIAHRIIMGVIRSPSLTAKNIVDLFKPVAALSIDALFLFGQKKESDILKDRSSKESHDVEKAAEVVEGSCLAASIACQAHQWVFESLPSDVIKVGLQAFKAKSN